MRQVRNDPVAMPDVVTSIQAVINVMIVNNIHTKVIDGNRFGVVLLQALVTDRFSILTRRMRVSHSKELPVMKDSQCFFYVPVQYIANCIDSHLIHLDKADLRHLLLLPQMIGTKFEQARSVHDRDFLLFTPLIAPESQISTTIITRARQAFLIFMMVGLRHVCCWCLLTGNMPVTFKMGIPVSAGGAESKVKNAYLFVPDFIIEFAYFTFDSVKISESECCVVLQLSHFQPEDNSCHDH